MATDNNRTLIDRLGKVSEGTLRQLRDSAGAGSFAGGGMAFKFKVGDRVRDLATGLAGVVTFVHAASRDEIAIRSVRLTDGRVVGRGVDELALDQAIAPAPEGSQR